MIETNKKQAQLLIVVGLFVFVAGKLAGMSLGVIGPTLSIGAFFY